MKKTLFILLAIFSSVFAYSQTTTNDIKIVNGKCSIVVNSDVPAPIKYVNARYILHGTESVGEVTKVSEFTDDGRYYRRVFGEVGFGEKKVGSGYNVKFYEGSADIVIDIKEDKFRIELKGIVCRQSYYKGKEWISREECAPNNYHKQAISERINEIINAINDYSDF